MPNGKLMIQEATESFIPDFERVFFAVLKEHDEKFHSSIILKKLFPTSKILVIDDVTRGQAETVVKMLKHFKISGSFLVKYSTNGMVKFANKIYSPAVKGKLLILQSI